MTGRDDVKSEPFTVGSFDHGNRMTDPYTVEDAGILPTLCYFASDDVEDPEEGIPLFGSASDGNRPDYNWDQCFGNLEDVGSSCILMRPWSNPQSGTQFLASDCLEDGEAMGGDDVPLPKMNGGTCVSMDMSEDGGGASSISHSDSDKASMAQVQTCAYRMKSKARSRRRLKRRKFVHGSVHSNSDLPPPHKLRKCRHICCKP